MSCNMLFWSRSNVRNHQVLGEFRCILLTHPWISLQFEDVSVVFFGKDPNQPLGAVFFGNQDLWLGRRPTQSQHDSKILVFSLVHWFILISLFCPKNLAMSFFQLVTCFETSRNNGVSNTVVTISQAPDLRMWWYQSKSSRFQWSIGWTQTLGNTVNSEISGTQESWYVEKKYWLMIDTMLEILSRILIFITSIYRLSRRLSWSWHPWHARWGKWRWWGDSSGSIDDPRSCGTDFGRRWIDG